MTLALLLFFSPLSFAQLNLDIGVPNYIRDDFPCNGSLNSAETNHNLSDFRQLLRNFENNMKSMSEFRAYINCYGSREHTKIFTDRFEELIKAASAKFQIPRVVFGCLIFRESQWDRNSVSKTGVRGAAQATRETIVHLNKVLADRKQYPDIYEAWSRYFLAVQDVADKDILSNPGRWPEYVPTALDPNNADTYDDLDKVIGFGAANMSYLQTRLNKALASHLGFKVSLSDYNLLLVGMYNSGDTGIANALASFAKKYPHGTNGVSKSEDWVEVLGRHGLRGEGVEHMKAIRNCMEHGNFKPMTKYDKLCDFE